MFVLVIGISQQELKHDKGHTPRGSSVMSHVSCNLSFLSQRPISFPGKTWDKPVWCGRIYNVFLVWNSFSVLEQGIDVFPQKSLACRSITTS